MLENPITEPLIPQAITRDTEFQAADTAHVAAVDPHSQYFNQARGDSRYRRLSTTAFFTGGTQEQAPYAACICSATTIMTAYSNAQPSNFTSGICIQGSYPGGGAAYILFHRPGSFIGLLGVDTDNKLKWGGGNVMSDAYEVWNRSQGTPVWQSPSDRRLKKNIKPIGSALDLLLQAEPVGFNYRNSFMPQDWSGSKATKEKKYYGFIADDFPVTAVVRQDENGFLTIDYTELIPFLVCALKETDAKIKNLENEVSKLKSELGGKKLVTTA